MAKRVLYIEDHEANFILVQRILQTQGDIVVEHAVTGEEGLTALRTAPPDLLLLDLDLPGIDGFEVATTARETLKLTLPIVAVSANVMKRERERALAAGCDAFIEKPFPVTELRNQVRERLGIDACSA